jgi:hypothetical protein
MSERSIAERLAEPFPSHEVQWKAQVVRGTRALAVAYVDARAVEDRLDAVFGVEGWQDSYQVLPNNSVMCKLRVRVGSDWIEKSDVGSQSDQPDEGDRLKSAFSDSIKRTAVKFGIGRYLYRLPQVWCDYDPQTRQLKSTPQLPDWAQCKSDPKPASKPAAQPPAKPANGVLSNRIDPEQWEKIKELLVKHHTSQRKFLDHFKVKKPGELTDAMYAEALTLALNPPASMRIDIATADGPERPAPSTHHETAMKILRPSVKQGVAGFELVYKALSKEQKAAVAHELARLREEAEMHTQPA